MTRKTLEAAYTAFVTGPRKREQKGRIHARHCIRELPIV
jgi:hypothetical protein